MQQKWLAQNEKQIESWNPLQNNNNKDMTTQDILAGHKCFSKI